MVTLIVTLREMARIVVMDGGGMGVTKWEIGKSHESSERLIQVISDKVVTDCTGTVVMGRAGPTRRLLLVI